MDSQLRTIIAAVDGLNERLDKGTFVNSQAIDGSSNGISLLALKNHSLLSYIHNLSAITATQIARSSEDYPSEDITNIRDKAVKNTIVDRIVLEKGIKGLEAKIAYQIEKVTKAYVKAKQQAETQINGKATGQEGDEEDDSDDDDKLNYKPNPTALKSSTEDSRGTDDKAAKYVAPKISAATPFAKDHAGKAARKQKNSTMEEFIQESSGAPIAEPSIGSTIMDGGRGGERTEKERRKQAEVQRYEEDNFTRLPGQSKKQAKRAAKQRQLDAQTKNFFGEDWGFTQHNNSNLEKTTKRKQKATSVWERTKKRQRSN